jgi:hypothetical protein
MDPKGRSYPVRATCWGERARRRSANYFCRKIVGVGRTKFPAKVDDMHGVIAPRAFDSTNQTDLSGSDTE